MVDLSQHPQANVTNKQYLFIKLFEAIHHQTHPYSGLWLVEFVLRLFPKCVPQLTSIAYKLYSPFEATCTSVVSIPGVQVDWRFREEQEHQSKLVSRCYHWVATAK